MERGVKILNRERSTNPWRNLTQGHKIKHRPYIDWPGIEDGVRCEAGDKYDPR
jgi:hypothetical protein